MSFSQMKRISGTIEEEQDIVCHTIQRRDEVSLRYVRSASYYKYLTITFQLILSGDHAKCVTGRVQHVASGIF